MVVEGKGKGTVSLGSIVFADLPANEADASRPLSFPLHKGCHKNTDKALLSRTED